MGRLERGKALSLRASWKHQKQFKKRARDQFIKAFKMKATAISASSSSSSASSSEDEKSSDDVDSVDTLPFLWGDEIECFLVKIPGDDRISLCDRTKEIIDTIAEKGLGGGDVLIQPEGCRHQLETTPGMPFSSITPSIAEKNMLKRREVIESLLKPAERLVLMPNFPRYGATTKILESSDTVADHPRYHALMGNLRAYRGGPTTFDVSFIDGTQETLAGMSYGVGMCALQVTCQMPDLESACFAYDKLAMIAPFLLAISACTPIIAGKVTTSDVRWGYSCTSIDDRTEEERKPGSSRRKSRFDTVWLYIHESSKELNDMPIPVDKESEQEMIEAGVPKLVAKHVAHVLERYTPIIYEDKLDVPDEECGMHHFGFANSLNWHSMRLKPPTKRNGWLVEFRICDVQLNEKDNAWLSCFIAAMSQAVIHLRPEWNTSISEMEENTRQSEQMDPVKNARYVWNGMIGVTLREVMEEVCDLVDEWVRSDGFTGDTSEMISVISWIRNISDGTILTGAQKIRSFLSGHPLYDCSNGLISEALCTDILREVCGMEVPETKDKSSEGVSRGHVRARRHREAMMALHTSRDPITGATTDCCSIM